MTKLKCPECKSNKLIKSGKANDKKRWLCKKCGRFTNYPIGVAKKTNRKILKRLK